MMAKERITVIVPVYNTAKFLRRCVESIFAQTYDNLEIILVDDGSTDDAPGICDDLASQDPRVRVVHQENRGLSGARNTGLDLASSDHIMFLDSDDEMLPAMVETLWYIMQKTGADITQCDFTEIIEGASSSEIQREKAFRRDSVGEIHLLRGRDKLTACLENWRFVVQWNKLFRREIFDGLRFPEGRYHEDEYVIYRELLAADLVAYTEQSFHLYYRHQASITWNPSMEKNFHKCEAFLDQAMLLADNGYKDLARMPYDRLIYQVNHCRAEKRRLTKTEEFYPRIQAIRKEADRIFPEFRYPLPIRLVALVRGYAFAVKVRLWKMKMRILSGKNRK